MNLQTTFAQQQPTRVGDSIRATPLADGAAAAEQAITASLRRSLEVGALLAVVGGIGVLAYWRNRRRSR